MIIRGFAAGAVATVLLPLAVPAALLSRKLRPHLSERLGGGRWRSLSPEPSIWIHAASLGELQGVIPFLKELRSQNKSRIVLTVTSLTGREKALELDGITFAALLPADHPFFIRRVFDRIQPKAFFVFETEIWPNLFSALERRGVSRFVVNGRISDRSFPGYKRWRFLFRPFVKNFTKCFVQTDRDRTRFITIGFPPAQTIVAGSTKYDSGDTSLTILPGNLRKELLIPPGSRLIVAGSVRPGETEIVLDAFERIKARHSNVRLLIAPRHPERFDEEARIVESRGFALSRRSAPADAAQVFLLDSLGELRSAYACGELCFVGGTLVDIGGHNPMEPALFGKPIILGPHTQNVADAAEDLITRGAAFRVSNAEEFSAACLTLLGSLDKLTTASKASESVVRTHKGAVQRILTGLPPLAHK